MLLFLYSQISLVIISNETFVFTFGGALFLGSTDNSTEPEEDEHSCAEIQEMQVRNGRGQTAYSKRIDKFD